MPESSNIQLSFIIPVYNRETIITRCLDSIYAIGIPIECFEVIVIDDCSTDNTLEVLHDYSQGRPNFTVIPLSNNKKAGGARNRGIEAAHGKYFMLVDSDDTVEKGVADALAYALGSGDDLLLCRIREQQSIGGPFRVLSYEIPEHKIFAGKEFCENYYATLIVGSFSHYLFSRSFYSRMEHPFAEGVFYEDLDWVEYLLYHCKQIEFDSSIIYSCYASPDSILHTQALTKDADKILYCYRRLKLAKAIQADSPGYSSRISVCTNWVQQILSFRHLTRYSPKGIRQLYDRIGTDAIPFFKKMDWKGSTSFCIHHPFLTARIISVTYPFALLARRTYRILHR